MDLGRAPGYSLETISWADVCVHPTVSGDSWVQQASPATGHFFLFPPPQALFS